MPWLHWQSLVDFGVLAAVLYVLLRWAQQTRALRLVLAIILLYAAGQAGRHFGLLLTSWVLTGVSAAGLVMIVILFPGELRHAFLRLDALLRLGVSRQLVRGPVFRQLAESAFAMAATRTGALIVIPGKDSIDEVVRGGLRFGALMSRTTLEAIFEKRSPLHDGAAVLSADRIERVGAVLPLSERLDLPPHFGTRHRAAMGLAERSDAMMVVVSEERGTVTMMQDRKAVIASDETDLVRLLEYRGSQPRRSWWQRMRGFATANLRYKGAAIGLAALIWGITVTGRQTAVRTVTVPVEFRNVPAKLEIVGQSASRIDIQLRGTPWLMDSFSSRALSVEFDLARMGAGGHALRVTPDSISPPPGIVVERVSPEAVSVQLQPRK